MVNEPATPTGQVIEEIKAALEADPTRLGDVWRRRKMTPKEIADEFELKDTAFVSGHRNRINALIKGLIPGTPHSAMRVAEELPRFVGRHPDILSEAAREYIARLVERADQVANDILAIKREDAAGQERTACLEEKDTPGIYVYTYPHYWRHSVLGPKEHGDTGAERRARTYLKVGKSGRGVRERVVDQMRGTAVPEKPIIVRIYTDPEGKRDLGKAESRLHRHLRRADHGRKVPSGPGKEWFLTHVEFLDDTADLLGLEVFFAAGGEGAT